MTNYLLSIDPSMKNTGFTLWENKKPILVTSYSFKKYNEQIGIDNFLINLLKNIKILDYSDLDIIMERGTFHSKNGIGYETQEHLRGFIAGQFNKLLTKNMLISPSKWKKWYINNYPVYCWGVEFTKEKSLEIANYLIKQNNWNIKVNNHDEADSLLIGWYFLNKENK